MMRKYLNLMLWKIKINESYSPWKEYKRDRKTETTWSFYTQLDYKEPVLNS